MHGQSKACWHLLSDEQLAAAPLQPQNELPLRLQEGQLTRMDRSICQIVAHIGDRAGEQADALQLPACGTRREIWVCPTAFVLFAAESAPRIWSS